MWGDALAPFCQERGPVVEVRWSEWAAPAGMEEQHAYLAEHVIDDAHDPAVVSYRQLLRTSGAGGHPPRGARHRGGGRRAKVKARRSLGQGPIVGRRRSAGGGDEPGQRGRACCACAWSAAGLVASAPLTPPGAGPGPAGAPRPDGHSYPGPPGAQPGRPGRRWWSRPTAGPLAARRRGPTGRSTARSTASFWFREWPRAEVGATWMSDLLLYGKAVRTVAVSYQPVPPRVSQRAITRQAAKLESDAEHRRKTRLSGRGPSPPGRPGRRGAGGGAGGRLRRVRVRRPVSVSRRQPRSRWSRRAPTSCRCRPAAASSCAPSTAARPRGWAPACPWPGAWRPRGCWRDRDEQRRR